MADAHPIRAVEIAQNNVYPVVGTHGNDFEGRVDARGATTDIEQYNADLALGRLRESDLEHDPRRVRRAASHHSETTDDTSAAEPLRTARAVHPRHLPLRPIFSDEKRLPRPPIAARVDEPAQCYDALFEP